MCGKRSYYKGKYPVRIAVAGFEVGMTSRSLRFLVRLKAFSGGLLKIFPIVLSSRRIRKFLEMIFSATRFWG